MATQYVTRDELAQVLKQLDRIEAKLDTKADQASVDRLSNLIQDSS